jgi:exonuclease SbcC
MRPVLLEIDGFVSFRDRATLDFTGAEYFALVGPTGAGKSTVIDAMSFALYGSVHRWDNPHVVKYALAPTASRATVRLVFDVGPARYVVAREVRRSRANILHKGRLERLASQDGRGDADEATEVLAADSGVTPAVEKLLGLTFEQFCTCVVLPQGDFADFLHASRSDRQKILLKLLGAEHYDAIARAANSSAASARQRMDVLTGQLADYTDATQDAENAAAVRADALAALDHQVANRLLPDLAAAHDELTTARGDQDRLESGQRLLADVTVPADVERLDEDLATATAARSRAAEAERDAQAADTAARELLAAAPRRAPLEQARRDHAEHARITAQLPEAERGAASTEQALTTATGAVSAAGAVVEQARAIMDDAAKLAKDADDVTQRLRREQAELAAVTIPPAVADLGERAVAARAGLQQAGAALADAEKADAHTRDLVTAAPARTPLEKALERFTELAGLERQLPALTAGADKAAGDQALAASAVAAAEQGLAAARAAQQAAAQAHQAAALREQLSAGDACPVCEQTVGVLPPRLHAPELATADVSVRAADQTVRDARHAERESADRLLRTQAARDQVTDRIDALQAATAAQPAGTPPGQPAGTPAAQPADAAEARAALADLDGLEADARAAAAALRDAREQRERAQQLAGSVEQEVSRGWADLRGARDPLVPLGAPLADEDDLAAGWTGLADWAEAAASERAAQLTAARRQAAQAKAALSHAEQQFAAAGQESDRCRAHERQATARRERAVTELANTRKRLAELVKTLSGALADADAQAALAELDKLDAATRGCDSKLRQARAEREQADRAAGLLDARVAAGWQQLRAIRDPLVGLGAPDLPADRLADAWAILVNWARAQLEKLTGELANTATRVFAATRRCDDLAGNIVGELKANGIDMPDGDLATVARPAVVAAVERARSRKERIAERRRQAGQLQQQHTAAQAEQQVAKLLGDLLSANNFQRWLAASALDTLLVDASANLIALSGGQFDLTHDNGELVVVDHYDADSQRPVKTLSGGETFQASLALALALSAQLSTLATGGAAAQLDSIFLDEGFGTLDEAALDVVAATLENLAKADRMVGVITHVQALAARIPVRFEVSRDERTSTLVRQAT